MSARPVIDDQIARALRAHLPEQAAPGLRARVLDEAETTAQLRPFPSFLGALSDADPVGRRRSLLIAAALLLLLALASTAAVGALRLFQQDVMPELDVEPPGDLPAFVLSSYERLPQLPPVAFTWHDGSGKGRVYVHRSGTVRFDRFASADATQPSGSTVINDNHRFSGMVLVESEPVWVEQGHEAIEDDPRVFVQFILNAGGGSGCEMSRDPNEPGSATAATGWRYVGAEYVAGRPTHHLACVGEHSLDTDLWLDIETRLILRTREPLTDDDDQPVPGQFTTTEVTEIAFGEQPAALFGPPEGVTRMSPDEYGAYICTHDLPNELVFELLGISESCSTDTEAEETPLATPTPVPTERPSMAPRPSGPAGPLVWTQGSPKEDWPAPVRVEPVGGPSVQPIPLTYFDPTGDTGSDIDPWVDIRAVTGNTSNVNLKLVSNDPPDVDPAENWIAYGVVIDEDGDGVPDWRYGIDNNVPTEAYAEGAPTRVWRTNLHTGRTDDKGFAPEGYGGPWPNKDDAGFTLGGTSDVAGGGSRTWGIELDMPFYTWASVIVNGRAVATDYAPDVGWLVATPGANPGGTYLLEEDYFPIDLTLTVPDGWAAGGPHVEHRGPGDDVVSLDFLIVDNPEDPCPDTTEPLPGPSFDDLVTYLEAWPLIDISESSDVTLDGYRGRYLKYTPVDREFDCHGGLIPVGQDNDAWLLDVDGHRLVIAASSTSASETVSAELRQIVESIQIEP